MSLPPLATCEDNPPCAKLCYARKFHTGFAAHTAGKQWDSNWELYQSDPDRYFASITDQLSGYKNIKLFRWHVGGDIPDQNYIDGMYYLSKKIWWIDFLAYTRRDWALPYSTKNLKIVRSLWLGEVDSERDRRDLKYPWFKVLPKGEPATCQGGCDRCAVCWYLKPGTGMTVNLH